MMHTAEDLALFDDDEFTIGDDVLFDQYMDTPSMPMMKPETRNIPFSMLPQIDYFGLDEDDREGTHTGPLNKALKKRGYYQ